VIVDKYKKKSIIS